MGVCCAHEKPEAELISDSDNNYIIDTEKLESLSKSPKQIKKCCQSKHSSDNDDNEDEDQDEKSCCGDFCKCCGKIAKTLSFNPAIISGFFTPLINTDNCFLYNLLIDSINFKGIFHPPILA